MAAAVLPACPVAQVSPAIAFLNTDSIQDVRASTAASVLAYSRTTNRLATQTDGEMMADEAMPFAIIQRPEDGPLTEPEPHALKPLVIDIPSAPNSGAPRLSSPAIFILANGERVETRRFLLTASVLTLSVDRRQRDLPLDMLDINATISANRERGIDLRIPLDRNEISLGF